MADEPTPPERVDAQRARLREVGAELAVLEPRRTELYAERLALFKWLRQECVPPVPHRDIGADAGVVDISVIAALRKDAEAQAKAAAKG